MHKVIHSLKFEKRGGFLLKLDISKALKAEKREGFLLKLDMSKAYDMVDWNFLMAVLQDFGFDS